MPKKPNPFDPWHCLLTGQSGSGKTTLACELLRRKPADVRFIFDHVGNVASRLGIEPVYEPELVPHLIPSGWVVFDPSRKFPGDFQKAAEWFADVAFYASHKLDGYKLWFCDELQFFTPRGFAPKPFRRIFEAGRNYGLHGMIVSQAPGQIPVDIRQQFTEVVTFHHSDPTILDRLGEWGFDREAVCGLQKFEFVARAVQRGVESRGKVHR